MKNIGKMIFGDISPFEGFDQINYPVDMQGWNSDHQFFGKLIEYIRPSVILEIGTWKGASAIHMANCCAAAGLDTEIVCIDTWLGSDEHFLEGMARSWLNNRNGYPQLYYTFMSNVLHAGLHGTITPMPLASESAAIVLQSLGVKADLIYVDGAHEYGPAYRDAQAYWPLLSDNGVMLFDDYYYPPVTKAVCQFAFEQDRPIYASYEKAFIPKGDFKPMLVLT